MRIPYITHFMNYREKSNSSYEKRRKKYMCKTCNYEYLFQTNLHAKIREKVIGKVFVKVNQDDVLIVKIESFGNLKFETSIDNFSKRILNGYSTDYAAYEIVKRYKSYIMKRYFK